MIEVKFAFRGGPIIVAYFENESVLCEFVANSETTGMYYFKADDENQQNERYPARNLAYILDKEVENAN